MTTDTTLTCAVCGTALTAATARRDLFGSPLCAACESPPPPVEEDEEAPDFHYVRVSVTREYSTELYLKVPKGWDPRAFSSREELREAADEQLNTVDWEPDRYSLEVSDSEVFESEQDALRYAPFYDLTQD